MFKQHLWLLLSCGIPSNHFSVTKSRTLSTWLLIHISKCVNGPSWAARLPHRRARLGSAHHASSSHLLHQLCSQLADFFSENCISLTNYVLPCQPTRANRWVARIYFALHWRTKALYYLWSFLCFHGNVSFLSIWTWHDFQCMKLMVSLCRTKK